MKLFFNKNFKSIKKNNRGSALVVCIIVLLFVSILSTIILYMSGINFRMKKSDLNTRISFYSAETPLETMQSNLIVPMSYTLNKSYMTTNSKYEFLGGEDERRRDFYKNYYKDLENLMISTYGGSAIGSDGSTETTNLLIKNIIHNLTYTSDTVLTDGIDTSHIFCVGDYPTILTGSTYVTDPYSFVTDLAAAGYLPDNFGPDPEVYIIVCDSFASAPAQTNYEQFVQLSVTTDTTITNPDNAAYDTAALKNADECRIVFKNVGVVVCQNGYRSIVITDLAMQFPPLDWDGGGGTSGYSSWDLYQLLYYVNWKKY